MAAAAQDQVDVFNALLEAGANLAVKDKVCSAKSCHFVFLVGAIHIKYSRVLVASFFCAII